MTGTNTFSPTDLQYTIPKIYSDMVNEEFFARLVAGKFFLDLSGDVSAGGNSIQIPDLYTNSWTALDKTIATEVTLASPAQSYGSLSIGTWKYLATVIEDKEAKQVLSSYHINEMYTRQMGGVLRNAFESSLFALYFGLTNVAGSASTTDVTDGTLREAVSQLDSGNIPAEDRAFFFYPEVYWEDLFGIAKLYDAATLGITSGPVKSGNIPTIYGYPVYLSTNVIHGSAMGACNLLAHKDAFAFALQIGQAADDAVRVQTDYRLENLGILIVADLLYGVLQNRNLAAVGIRSRLTGIVS